MAAALTSAPSSAHTVEVDLAALWCDVAAAGPISRAAMSNLVIVGDRTDRGPAALLEEPLVAAVARLHPARIIALEYHAGARACPPTAATVGIMTFGAGQPRYGVEMIAVRLECAGASLPSVVRALTRGDMPTTIWWKGDLSASPAAITLLELG